MFRHEVTKEGKSQDSHSRHQSISIVSSDDNRVNDDSSDDNHPNEFGKMSLQERVVVNDRQTGTNYSGVKGFDDKPFSKPIVGNKQVSNACQDSQEFDSFRVTFGLEKIMKIREKEEDTSIGITIHT